MEREREREGGREGDSRGRKFIERRQARRLTDR